MTTKTKPPISLKLFLVFILFCPCFFGRKANAICGVEKSTYNTTDKNWKSILSKLLNNKNYNSLIPKNNVIFIVENSDAKNDIVVDPTNNKEQIDLYSEEDCKKLYEENKKTILLNEQITKKYKALFEEYDYLDKQFKKKISEYDYLKEEYEKLTDLFEELKEENEEFVSVNESLEKEKKDLEDQLKAEQKNLGDGKKEAQKEIESIVPSIKSNLGLIKDELKNLKDNYPEDKTIEKLHSDFGILLANLDPVKGPSPSGLKPSNTEMKALAEALKQLDELNSLRDTIDAFKKQIKNFAPSLKSLLDSLAARYKDESKIKYLIQLLKDQLKQLDYHEDLSSESLVLKSLESLQKFFRTMKNEMDYLALKYPNDENINLINDFKDGVGRSDNIITKAMQRYAIPDLLYVETKEKIVEGEKGYPTFQKMTVAEQKNENEKSQKENIDQKLTVTENAIGQIANAFGAIAKNFSNPSENKKDNPDFSQFIEKLGELQNKLNTAQGEIKKKGQALTKRRNKVANLRKKVKEFETKLEIQKKELEKQYKEQIDKIRAQLDTTNQEKGQLSQAVQTLLAHIEDVTKAKNAAEERASVIKRELDEKENKVQKEREALGAVIGKYQEYWKSVEAKIRSLGQQENESPTDESGDSEDLKGSKEGLGELLGSTETIISLLDGQMKAVKHLDRIVKANRSVIKNTEEAKEEIEKKLNEKTGELQNLNSALRNLEKEKEKLSEKIGELKISDQAKDESILKLNKDITQVKGDYDSLSQNNLNMAQLTNELNKEIIALKKKENDLNTNHQKEIQAAQAKIADLETKLTETHKTLSSSAKEFTEQLTTAVTGNNELDGELKEKARVIEERINNEIKLGEEIERLKQELEKARENHAKTTKKMEEASQKSAKELKDIEEQKQTAEEKIKTQEQEIDQLKQQKNQSELQLTEAITSLQNELNSIQGENEKKDNQAVEDKIQLRRVFLLKLKKIAQQKKELDLELKRANQKHEKAIETFQKQKDQLEQEKEGLKGENEGLVKKNTGLASKTEELNKQLNEANTKIKEATDKESTLNKEIQNLQNQFLVKQQDLSKLVSQVKTKDAIISANAKEIEDLTNKMSQQQKQISELNTAQKRKEMEIQSLETKYKQELKLAKSELGNLKHTNTEQAAQKKNLEEKIQQIEANYSKAINDKQAEIKTLELQRGQLNQGSAQLKSDLVQKQKDLEKSIQKSNIIETEKKQLQENFDEIINKILDENKKIILLEAQIKNLEAERIALYSQIEESRKDFEWQSNNLNNAHTELGETKNTLKKTTEELQENRKQVNQLKNEGETKDRAIIAKDKAIIALDDQIKVIQKQKDDLEKEITKIKEQLEQSKEEFKRAREEAKVKEGEQSEKIRKLEEEIKARDNEFRKQSEELLASQALNKETKTKLEKQLEEHDVITKEVEYKTNEANAAMAALRKAQEDYEKAEAQNKKLSEQLNQKTKELENQKQNKIINQRTIGNKARWATTQQAIGADNLLDVIKQMNHGGKRWLFNQLMRDRDFSFYIHSFVPKNSNKDNKTLDDHVKSKKTTRVPVR